MKKVWPRHSECIGMTQQGMLAPTILTLLKMTFAVSSSISLKIQGVRYILSLSWGVERWKLWLMQSKCGCVMNKDFHNFWALNNLLCKVLLCVKPVDSRQQWWACAFSQLSVWVFPMVESYYWDTKLALSNRGQCPEWLYSRWYAFLAEFPHRVAVCIPGSTNVERNANPLQ